MKKYKVYHSARFDKELEKHDKTLQDFVDKIEDQLVDNPYSGDPIDSKIFREKRFEKFRIYYLVYEDLESVFMVAISEKKDQQRVINTIKLFLDSLKDELESLVDKDKIT